ncbi:MAG: hypothetical protein JSV88_19480 [Candidatus Aminicenantes bacterium]|nr:MAG: hypothetical protein JSV88_19480 [Candidatus Aminicenantes bacterium]
MNQDPEINALSKVNETLKGLNRAQIKRIIDWITSKFELLGKKPVMDKAGPPGVTAKPVETAEPIEKPVKKRRGRRPKKAQPKPGPEQTEIKGFMKYETVEDLFFASNVRTIASKILLVAAYLQEKHNFKEFSSLDINSRLKNIGQGVQNITTSINSLVDKKPPLLIQTRKMGDSKQAKRKFRVTEEGLRIARNYLIQQ